MAPKGTLTSHGDIGQTASSVVSHPPWETSRVGLGLVWGQTFTNGELEVSHPTHHVFLLILKQCQDLPPFTGMFSSKLLGYRE